jgi:hypothetical protein
MLPLETVHEQLLHAGITPRHARRYVMELRDHLTDLISRERTAGLDVQEAEVKARHLLGSDAQLVHAMIEGGAPRSLAAKAPWAVFGVLPPFVLIVTALLLGKWSYTFLFPYQQLSVSDIPESVRTISMASSFIGSFLIGPTLAAICVVIALRQRLSSRWVWVGLAMIALVCGPFGAHVQFPTAESGASGGIRGSVLQAVFENDQINAAATLTLMAVRTIVLFAVSALAYRVLRQRVEGESA